jgi:hypothetical protein
MVHLQIELLERFVGGSESPDEHRRIVQHLLSGCVPCVGTVKRMLHSRRQLGSGTATFRTPTPIALAERSREQYHDMVAELERRPLLGNLERFGDPGLVEVLLSDAVRLRTTDPQRCVQRAELAYRLCRHWPTRIPPTCRILAAAELANGLRLRGDFHHALLRMEEALNELSLTADPSVRPHVLSLAGSLFHDERQHQRCIQVLMEAFSCYSELGDQRGMGVCLIKLAEAHALADNPTHAKRLAAAAAEMIDRAEEPTLALTVAHNLVRYELLEGNADRALTMLERLRPSYEERGGERERIKELWLRGQIMLVRGAPDAAVPMLREVRGRMVARGQVYEVVVVALDLATALALMDKRDEVVLLAAETYALAQAAGAELEALAAIALLAAMDSHRQTIVNARAVLLSMAVSRFGKPQAGN